MEGLPALWVVKHKIKNESGIQLDFSKRKFLWDIYNDLSAKQAFLKPPQIGATVMSNLKSLWVAKKLKRDIIYTLPTATDVNDIVGGSVNRIITQNPILREWVKDHDTVEQKSVGQNLIRYRGTFSPKQATMVPSSLNIHDEVDNSDQGVLTLYETRLEAQEDESMKWRWYFSHPSLTGHGVDIYWQQSDKKEWYIKCNACRAEQTLSWPDSINMNGYSYVCKHCAHVLEDRVRIEGRWKNQDGVPWEGEIVGPYQFSGWHVSQLMLFNKSAKDIITAFNDPLKDKQYFYNYVLGLPYMDSDDKIDPATVLRNCVPEVNDQGPGIIIGVDPGLPIHYCLGNQQGIFNYGTCDNWSFLEGLLRRFPRSIIISDQGGDLTPQRELMERYPGRVFICYYRKDKKTKEIINWGEDDKYGEVVVDRNRMMTLMVGQLMDIGRIRFNGTKDDWAEFAEHFGNIYREKIMVKEVKDKDDRSLYGNEYVWKRNGPDHYAHALLYTMVGLTRNIGALAKTTAPQGFEELPRGYLASEGGIPIEAFRNTVNL